MTFEAEDIKSLLPAIISLVGVFSGGWWMRRFIGRTDDAIEELASSLQTKFDSLKDSIHDLKVKAEVTKENRAFVQGQLNAMQSSVRAANEAAGAQAKRIDKVWEVLERKFDCDIPKRLSDQGK